LEFLIEYGLFFAKAVTIVVAIGLVIGLLVSAGSRDKKDAPGHIEVRHLNDDFEDMRDTLKHALMNDHELKAEYKAEKKAAKEKDKAEKKALKKDDSPEVKKRVYVLDFDGDMKASATAHLREEITAVLTMARPEDEVVVKLESGGGMVHSYGLASSQLARISSKGIPLTVCVDKVAASGGYMMACVADKILAAPFAIIGSIGVVAQLPNFNRLLKKNDIDVELLTAGEHKRTLTMFGENTDKDREKFIEDLEDTHALFKEFVKEHRDVVDIDAVASGDVWYGSRAMGVNLVDGLETSDEYLNAQMDSANIYAISFEHKKTLPEKMGIAAQHAVDGVLLNWWQRAQNSRWFT
jgi:serine protease SohB